LPQQAYVWQRAWNQPVVESVGRAGGHFGGLVALGAQIQWVSGQPHVDRVSLDYEAMRDTKLPCGVALRIGSYPGPFAADDAAARLLADVAGSLIKEASAHGLTLSELQIDFDCASAKLGGYRVWVEMLRRACAPIPVTITVLPSWMDAPGFVDLARTAGGYVLQVHSVDRPASADAPMTLCDPAKARQWVRQADRVGVPFRVALPTYGYVAAFGPKGKLIGLSAEGPSTSWPAGAILRELHANPTEIGELVRVWTDNRPKNLRGLIWYRLPVDQDTLNWRWLTLLEVMAGRSPKPDPVVQVNRTSAALYEVVLVNRGLADALVTGPVALSWRDARLLAGDGLGGFELQDSGGGSARLTSRDERRPARIEPAGRLVVGWLRLDRDTEVHADAEAFKK
jgi:hypothetical protein